MTVAIPGSNPPSGPGHHHEVPGYPKRELYLHNLEVVQCTCGDFFQLRYEQTGRRSKSFVWRPLSRWQRKLRREAEARIAADEQRQKDNWERWANG